MTRDVLAELRAKQNERAWLHKSGVIVRVPRETIELVPDIVDLIQPRDGEKREVWNTDSLWVDPFLRDCVLVKLRRTCADGTHPPDRCTSRFPIVEEGCLYDQIDVEEWFEKYDRPGAAIVERRKRRIAL